MNSKFSFHSSFPFSLSTEWTFLRVLQICFLKRHPTFWWHCTLLMVSPGIPIKAFYFARESVMIASNSNKHSRHHIYWGVVTGQSLLLNAFYVLSLISAMRSVYCLHLMGKKTETHRRWPRKATLITAGLGLKLLAGWLPRPLFLFLLHYEACNLHTKGIRDSE